MIYLGMSIIAAIILVAIAIRRLPYLRHHRLGLEIMAPKPFINNKTPVWMGVWNRVQTLFQGLTSRRPPYPLPQQTMNPLVRQTYNPALPTDVPELNPMRSNAPVSGGASAAALPATAYPGDFWQEEVTKVDDPFEIPTQGLITRRGEAQKIAQELTSHADEAFRKKNYKDAEKFYLQAATKDPDNARIYNRLGVIYLQTKDYKDAVEAFRRSLKFDDRVASRHFNLALAYLGKRDYRSAEKGMREAIRLDPTNDKYRKTFEAIQRHPV